MEFTLSQKIVGNDFSIINAICSKTNSSASVGLCLFSLSQKNGQAELTLTATDLDFLYQRKLNVTGQGEGQVCVPPLKLANFLNALGGKEVEIQAVKNSHAQFNGVKATSQGYVVNLLGADKDQFPTTINEEVPFCLKITVAEFLEILRLVGFCIQSTNIRRNLTGMHLNWHEGQWHFVGTDSHRVSLVKKPTTSETAPEVTSLILPKRALIEIAKILAMLDPLSTVDLHFDQRAFLLKTGQSFFRALLIAEDYPNILSFYNATNPSLLTINRSVLDEALKVFKAGLERDYNSLFMEITAGSLKLSYETNQSMTSREIEISYDGEPLKLAFNLPYLWEAIESFADHGEVMVQIKDSQSPVIFSHPDLPQYKHILMPLRF